MTLTYEDLAQMNRQQLAQVMHDGHPLDLDALVDTEYQGIDLSMPSLFHKLAWKTFRKTFHRDPQSGILRGWNVRMQQQGVDGPRVPMYDRKGQTMTFGHYHVLPADGLDFPDGWRGAHYLDYRYAGNEPWDMGKLGYCPLVQVNPDDPTLLLGWEIFKVGPAKLALPDYWALRLEGPLTEVAPIPRA